MRSVQGGRRCPRCEECAGGNEMKECVENVDKPIIKKNLDLRCPVRDSQLKVARVRVVQKVSYAEAVK